MFRTSIPKVVGNLAVSNVTGVVVVAFRGLSTTKPTKMAGLCVVFRLEPNLFPDPVHSTGLPSSRSGGCTNPRRANAPVRPCLFPACESASYLVETEGRIKLRREDKGRRMKEKKGRTNERPNETKQMTKAMKK